MDVDDRGGVTGVEIIYQRVAGIDVGKKEVAVTVRVPGASPGAARVEVTRKFKTFYPVLAVMAAWLGEQGVTHVVMESTGIYWRPVFHALCEVDADVEVLLVNAAHVKNVPGRKTDVKDSQWLAQLLEVGLLRGSFIPPKEIAAIREVTRYRKKIIQSRTSELQRLGKVLEDAGVKIDSVASSLTTKSARDMIEALIAGERDPRVLADLARGVMRAKIPDLSMALAGRFADHHGVLARLHLDMIDHFEVTIARLDAQVEAMTDPFAAQIRALCSIPGIGERIAQVIVSEIGVDMGRFPTAAHLASWAGLCPGNNESAGKHGNTRTRKGNQEIRTALVEAAWATARTHTYLGARFRRLHRRFGRKNAGKAAVAIAHDLIVITWHVLHDGVDFHDLGADYFTRPDSPAHSRRKDHLVHELQALGYTVQTTPAA
jgi:transposase